MAGVRKGLDAVQNRSCTSAPRVSESPKRGAAPRVPLAFPTRSFSGSCLPVARNSKGFFFSPPSEINERYKGGRQQGVALHCYLQASAEIKWKTQSWWEEPAARLGGSHQRAEELGFSYRQQPLLKLKYLEGTSGFLAFREQDELLASGNLSPVSHMKHPDTSRLGQGGLSTASPALPVHLPAWLCTDSSGGRPRMLTARSEHYCHNSEKMMMAHAFAPSYLCN